MMVTASAGTQQERMLLTEGVRECFGVVPAQAVAYPADTVRRRIQLSGSVGQRISYRGYWDCVRRMAREEGLLSFYRGLGVNCLKIAPAAALQFLCYDLFKSGVMLYAAVVAARNG